MRSTPPNPQERGLAWSISLDLVALAGRDRILELDALRHPRFRGHAVTLHVGTLAPDDRATLSIVETIGNGVHVTIDGSPRAVSAWWRALHHRSAASRPARHLELVRT